MNNLIFIAHAITISVTTIVACRLGRSFLVSTLAMYGILANLFVLKQISLFGLGVTSSDVFIVGISLGLNLLQEKYDQEVAQKAVWASFWCLGTYTILSQFQLWYMPNAQDVVCNNYAALLSIAPKLTLASLISYVVSQTIDVNLYGYLRKKLTSNRFYFIRNYTSIAVSQLVDTILFSFLGLYGLGYNMLHIIAFSYFIKLLAITISVTSATTLKRFIKT